MRGSLPFDYESIGKALSYLDDLSEDCREFSRQLAGQSELNRSPGTHYDKNGRPIPYHLLAARGEPVGKENQHGWLLNQFGNQGNRVIWPTYTAGARQANVAQARDIALRIKENIERLGYDERYTGIIPGR